MMLWKTGTGLQSVFLKINLNGRAFQYDFKPAHLSFNIFNPRYLLCNAIGLQPSLLSEVIDEFRLFKKIHLILSYVMYWKYRDFQVALKNVKDTLLILSQPSELQKNRFEKLYDVFDVPIQNGRLTMCKSRPFINNGTAVQQQSYLIDGKSRIGRRIVNDHRIHCASPNKQMLHMIDKGYLVIGARKIFKKIRSDCVTGTDGTITTARSKQVQCDGPRDVCRSNNCKGIQKCY